MIDLRGRESGVDQAPAKRAVRCRIAAMRQYVDMAGEATAMITFAVRSVYEELRGPAGSRLWRPGYTACLIEKHLPVWVVSPVGFAASPPRKWNFVSYPQGDRPIISDVVLMMAGLFGGSDDLRRAARHEGLLRSRGRLWWVAPNADLPPLDDFENEDEADAPPCLATPELVNLGVAEAARLCRVSAMIYPSSTLKAEDSVTWMRSAGLDVDEFVLAVAGTGPDV